MLGACPTVRWRDILFSRREPEGPAEENAEDDDPKRKREESGSREKSMAYDPGVAQRLREALQERQDIREKKMFGGLAFLLGGNMCCGVVGHELMVRVGPEAYEEALNHPHARKMDFTGQPLRGFVYVAAEGIEDDEELEGWVQRGVDFAASLPAK
jgi:TfoX/Sxy family transcriptional regulator of competence genes